MKTPCQYCGMDLKLDLTDSLKETLSEGPTVCE
jgi:hypothetical protein